MIGDRRDDWTLLLAQTRKERVAMSGASGGSTHAPTRCLYVSPVLKGEETLALERESYVEQQQ